MMLFYLFVLLLLLHELICVGKEKKGCEKWLTLLCGGIAQLPPPNYSLPLLSRRMKISLSIPVTETIFPTLPNGSHVGTGTMTNDNYFSQTLLKSENNNNCPKIILFMWLQVTHVSFSHSSAPRFPLL